MKGLTFQKSDATLGHRSFNIRPRINANERELECRGEAFAKGSEQASILVTAEISIKPAAIANASPLQ